MLTLIIIEGIVVLLLTVLVAGLLRSHAEILRTLHRIGAIDAEGTEPAGPLPRRAPATTAVAASSITGVTPGGATVSISLTQGRGFTLLAFLSSGCTTCQAFWKGLEEQRALPLPDIRTVVVTAGPERESPAKLLDLAPAAVTTIMSSEAWDAFRVPATPYFQLIDVGAGVALGEGSANSWRRLNDLIERALGDDALSALPATTQRLRDSERELSEAGIEPDDEALYHRPFPT